MKTEHFSTPLHFAQQHFSLRAELIPFPSGTGHMIQALKGGEIDVGIGLTEGWVAGLAREEDRKAYQLVGTYVETPLRWAISTGANRPDIHSITSFKGSKLGVSRIGSGSNVMAYVLADQQGWLSSSEPPFFKAVPLGPFAELRKGVNEGTADFFMWEHFTTKKYHDNGELTRLGDISTPWSSWKIVARPDLVGDPVLDEMFDKVNKGVEYFCGNQAEAVEFITKTMEYSEEDARAWLSIVRFAEDVKGVAGEVVEKTIGILRKAGVFEGDVGVKEMVGIERA